MEVKDILTLCGLVLNGGGLIVALVKFTQEQKRANTLKQEELNAKAAEVALQAKAERRTEYKLRIHRSLLDECLSVGKIIRKFNDTSPLQPVDEIELRKCIYEMLVEDTLVAFEDGKYSANTMDDDDWNGDDEGDEDESDADSAHEGEDETGDPDDASAGA